MFELRKNFTAVKDVIMIVNFRVVGIFCDLRQIDVGEFIVPPTIRDVMSAIRGNPAFNFTFTADDEANPSILISKASLLSATYRLTSPVASKSGNDYVYPAGDYTLADSIDMQKQVLHIFQYYLQRPIPGTTHFENISSGNRFVSFGNSEKVQDGDSIIWRQVSIKLPAYQMKSHEQFKRFESLGIA